MTKPEIKYLHVDSLEASSWNPQEQDDTTFEELVDSIKENGFIDVIQVVPVDDGSYRIIGGMHRWLAAKQAGLEEIPAVILSDSKWKDEDLQKFLTVKMNVLRGKTNTDKFLPLYNEMSAKYGRESVRKLFGFTDQKAFNKLIDGVKKGLKKTLPNDLQSQFEDASKDAQTVDDLMRIVQALLAQYGDSLNLDYMIFTHGKKEHIYVAMDAKLAKSIKTITKYCKIYSSNINDVIGPRLIELAETLEKEVAGKKSKPKAVKDDGPAF